MKRAAVTYGPALLFGLLSGIAAGLSAPVFWALQAIAVAGAIAAGGKNSDPRNGAVQGLIAGALFGAALLLAVGRFSDPAFATAPPLVQVAITSVGGATLNALGYLVIRTLKRPSRSIAPGKM